MLEKIKEFGLNFLEKTKDKSIVVVSHFDCDGITSAAILCSTLKRLDKNFSVNIVKSLDPEFIKNLPNDKVIVFLDLASGSLEEINNLNNLVYIVDHHEIRVNLNLKPTINILNPHLYENGELMSGACLTYLFSREINKKDQDLANLAVIGMVGDLMEKNVGALVNSIIKEADLTIKKGLLLYPSTRPLNKTLEYCSNPYIPGVTGNYVGALNLLREIDIGFNRNGYKSLVELTDEEMQKLVTAIALRLPDSDKIQNFIGNLYLVKFHNHLEDARELSALINACSRMGESNIALLFCMGNSAAKKQAESIYIKYKQSLIAALDEINKTPKIEGKQYVIMNAKDKIQDTIIGTVASILSMSALYKEGTVIVAMAYNQDKIKVSTRISGREKIPGTQKNLKDLMDEVTELIGGDSGGHEMAAGCVISKEQEEAFISVIKKKLDIEIVKV